MSFSSNRESNLLMELIALCTEAAGRFTHASQQAHDYELKAVLREFAYLRSQMAQLLQTELKRSNPNLPVPAIAVKPAWHACMAVKSLFSGGDLGILRRCGRAEQVLLDHYQAASAGEITPHVEPMLRRHCQIVILGVERLRSLRKAHQIRRNAPAVTVAGFSTAAQ